MGEKPLTKRISYYTIINVRGDTTRKKENKMPKFMLGNARHQLDERNRFRIPAKFREGLGECPYLLPGRNGCMYIVPEERFEELFNSLIGNNPYTSDAEDFTTQVFSLSSELDEDAQGRVTLSKEASKLLKANKELVFVGKVTYLEMWSAEAWEERYGVLNPDKLDKMLQDLKKRGA